MRSTSIYSNIAALFLCGILAACGSSGGGGSNTPPPVNMQGQWLMAVTPATPPEYTSWVNVNLSQTGADVSADSQNVAIFSNIPTVGSTCGGTATISGTISNGNSLSFTLTETGPNGTSTATVAEATLLISNGTVYFQSTPYTIPAGTTCGIGYGSVSGDFIGGVISPFSGTYSGTLNGNPTTVTITQRSGYTVTVSGQTNMSAVGLSGDVIGASFDAKGTVGGSQVEWIGLGNPQQNSFLIFDASHADIGRLNR